MRHSLFIGEADLRDPFGEVRRQLSQISYCFALLAIHMMCFLCLFVHAFLSHVFRVFVCRCFVSLRMCVIVFFTFGLLTNLSVA